MSGAHGPHGLPPGQRRTEKWPVLDLGERPWIKPEDWTLDICGEVENPVTLDWAAFLALPQAEARADIHCVTSWSLPDFSYAGVSGRTIAELVKPMPIARFVLFRSHDGYSTNMPIARFLAPDSLLAHTAKGAPIPPEHGGPVRVVVPSLYFWKSAKWVRRIIFAEADSPGYWEVRGYHNEADPWKEQRFSGD